MSPDEIKSITAAFQLALAPLLAELNEIRLQVTKEPDWTPNYKTLDVPAGVGKSVALNVTGKYFLCASTTADFDVQFDDGEKFTCKGGLFVPLAPKGFRKITIFNLSATDVLTVAFYASNTPLSFTGLLGG